MVEQTLEKMRFMLKKRGADGIQGLARNFRICDTNGSGQLDEEELAKVCALILAPGKKWRLQHTLPRSAPALRVAHTLSDRHSLMFVFMFMCMRRAPAFCWLSLALPLCYLSASDFAKSR